MARSASGTRRFTSVDFPTPEWPSSTVTLSANSGATASSGSSRPAVAMVRSRSANCAANGSGGARSDLVRHRIGARPPAYAAISARSTNPVRGGGSASATTMSSWSAFATTTRSVGSVSSAVRRNTVRRSPRRTMRARVSARPDRSPTRSTSSPTTIGVRPSSRARIAVTRRSGSRPSTQPHRPRSTVTTMPSWASACSGRVLVRGREPRPGLIRTSDSS